MEQRPLGTTGLNVSALGFGGGAVGGLMVGGDRAEQRAAVARALDAGITYFDTAASYGDGLSETHLGEVMRDLGAWSKVVVGTKFRLRPEDVAQPAAAVRASLEASLKRLGRDDVDVLHLHNPIALVPRAEAQTLDIGTAVHQVALALQEVVGAGLVRHCGFTGLGDTAALREVVLAQPYETVQTYFNVLNPSAGFTGHAGGQQDFEGLIDSAARAGRGVIVIRVLAAGAATATPTRARNAGDPGNLPGGGTYASDLERAAGLSTLAAELGLEGPVELAIRFGLSKPGVSTVLVGYSSLAQLEEAVRYAERGPLTPDAIQRVLSF